MEPPSERVTVAPLSLGATLEGAVDDVAHYEKKKTEERNMNKHGNDYIKKIAPRLDLPQLLATCLWGFSGKTN